MLTQNLTDLKRHIKSLLVEDGMGAAMQELEKTLPPDSPKFNVLLQLKARLHETNLKKIKHVISDEQATLQYDRLRDDLLTFLNGLQEKDFAADAAKKAKTGSVLYRIPRCMERQKETKCIVRLAFDEEAILQNIELSADVTLQPVRVSEAMEVHLIDPRGGENFAIRTISSPEQFLEQDEYSEWVFYVTPLKMGRLPLVLKVCVLEQVGGKERKREIVLEEIIVVTAEPLSEAETEKTEVYLHCGYYFTFINSTDQNKQYNRRFQREEPFVPICCDVELSDADMPKEGIPHDIFNDCFSSLGVKCQKILSDCFDGYSNPEIMKRQGYINHHSFKTIKSRCWTMLVNSIRQKLAERDCFENLDLCCREIIKDRRAGLDWEAIVKKRKLPDAKAAQSQHDACKKKCDDCVAAKLQAWLIF